MKPYLIAIAVGIVAALLVAALLVAWLAVQIIT